MLSADIPDQIRIPSPPRLAAQPSILCMLSFRQRPGSLPALPLALST